MPRPALSFALLFFSIQQDKEASVLCVDPDRESRALLEDLLAEFNPVFADNAFDALLHQSNLNFDAYVLEMWLPDFSGLAFCREIRRTDPSAPIVFCTGETRRAVAIGG